MKTINILITTVILLINVDLYSQINVDNVGDVSIGQVIYTKKHNLGYRTIELKSPNWDGGFIIDKSGYNSMSTFRPNTTWYGSLGTSSYHFGVGYIEHIYTWILTNYSDERLKENIENIETPLEKIIKLNGVTYNLKDSNNIELESSEYKDQSFKKKQIGFLAQDLQTVFPDLVFQESDSSEYCINYIGLIPVLVESIKEQQSMLN
ncbi:MAG: tail fiber domain-containing protein [Bacteroidales bacterium]|nr:tail fiber domain-containing protein [Bacteroidales bacterium]